MVQKDLSTVACDRTVVGNTENTGLKIAREHDLAEMAVVQMYSAQNAIRVFQEQRVLPS